MESSSEDSSSEDEAPKKKIPVSNSTYIFNCNQILFNIYKNILILFVNVS